MTEPQYSSQGRTERLIATGRVVLAVSSLFAIWLDPMQPATNVEETYLLMAGYVVYALLLALLVWTSRLSLLRYRLVTLVVDIAAFFLFTALTEGPPTSPFYVYFVFAILCATLRWGWRGTLWTTLPLLTAFVYMGLFFGSILDDERLNRFIIRSVYLAVIAVMLGFLGAFEQQRRSEIARLAGWPPLSRGEPSAVVQEMLGQAARTFGAPRVMLVWDEPEEPWVNVATWTRGAFEWKREAPGVLDPLVSPDLAEQPFFCLDASAPVAKVVTAIKSGGYRHWWGTPVPRGLCQRFSIRAVLSLPLDSDTHQGRLFFLDKSRMHADDAVLSRIVAHQVGAILDNLYLQQRLQQAAVMEERVRFARDLHDGLLQSLAATALQLQATRRLVEQDPAGARARLEEIQQVIAAEQRNLRSYIRDLRPVALLASRGSAGLSAALRSLGARIERQWGVRVDMRVGELTAVETAGLAHHVSHIVHEAVVNAARHGGATLASVTVTMAEEGVTIVVTDNGRGFAFEGRYDLFELERMQAGPVSLKERVAALRGDLVVESSPAGARVTITLPVAAVAT